MRGCELLFSDGFLIVLVCSIGKVYSQSTLNATALCSFTTGL